MTAPDPNPPVPAVPRATYRLQFRAGFGFEDACRVVPYLAALGVSHLYASPITMARPGSTHGYDVIDFNRLNPELGDEAAFDALVETLHGHGMGLVLDFVPNHMGVGSDNPWWLDVLEWGRESPYAAFFDIDFEAAARGARDKIVLPVLGDQYGKVLEAGELRLAFVPQAGSFHVAYYDHRFPIDPRTYRRVLERVAARLGDAAQPLAELAWRFALTGAGGTSRARPRERREEAAGCQAELAALVANDGAVAAALAAELQAINGTPDRPQSFRALHRLLEEQAYRLASWRVASSEINYRRFFDINDLAGLRMERPEVFEATHRFLLRLIADDKVQGVRLDHIDGLFDPFGYCERLLARVAQVRPPPDGEPGAAIDARAGRPIYLLAEKILARHEHLREELQVAGTTGYEFMTLAGGLFVDPAAERHLTRTYQAFVDDEIELAPVVQAAKRQILRYTLNSELHVLAQEFHRLAQQSWLTRDFTLTGLREALSDVITAFPVYRTYITARGPAPDDRRDLDWAVSQARRQSGIVDQSVFDFLHAALSTDLATNRAYRRADVVATAMHFQQLTGPVMAKSLEDTAFYRYNRLISLNEVGGEPDRFGVSPAAFHTVVQRQQRYLPLTMLTTSTHDHKRGEDVRARIDVLSEMPQEWRRRVRRWALLNRFGRQEIGGRPAPSRNHEYLLYQTLVGAWPIEVLAPQDLAGHNFADRVAQYMTKAMREAKQETSWTAPDAEYEAGVEQFVRRALDPERSRPFLADLLPFQQRVALVGAVNGLAQILLKLTAPGVPDFYQGTELWDLSLVDPDNRRPVDFAVRGALLERLRREPPAAGDLLADWRSGAIKQFVLLRALQARGERPDLFTRGGYTALQAEGPMAERVVAFARGHEDALALTVAPRLAAPLVEGEAVPLPPPERWQGTRLVLPEELQGRTLVDALSGQTITPEGALDVGQVLRTLPLALLISIPAGPAA